jgi:molybdenum cofactor guanylyltransferase
LDQGPLAGVIAGLEAATEELCFVVATDAPLIVPVLVAEMLSLADEDGHDIVCPDIGGYRQPLVAVYRKSTCPPAFQRSLDAGNRRILVAYEGLRVHVPCEEDIRAWDPDLRSFRNANTAEALAELAQLLGDES